MIKMNPTKIYLVENCFNDPNKIYIGKTINTRRYNHTKKYGLNIKYTIIDIINSNKKEDYIPLEKYWIEQFRQWGFKLENKNKGGGGCVKRSKKWNKNHSLMLRGKPKPPNFGKNLSKMLKGKSKHTKESKTKISERMKNHPSLKSPQRREKIRKANSSPINQFDLEGNFIKTWESQTKAALKLNIPQPNISAACLGKQKTAYGFIWKLKD